MPTTLEWLFEGGADGSQLAARRGTQRVYFGDTVIDEVMGEGKALRIEAANIVMEMTNADGEKTEVVKDQWEEMGGEILSEPSLMGLKYHDLWARTLLLSSDEYPLVLRLVVISLIVPADTSECERIFSLMNDIKTAERARMGQRNLKNLMLWHRMAKDLKAQDVPVMAILKEFRAMAGEVGRRPHRAQNPITYEYEKNRQ